MKAIKIAKDTFWVGAKDPDLRLFDLYVRTDYGTTYNSYLVKGERVALIDAVKDGFEDQLFARLQGVITPAQIDYLIVNHNEPDHSGSINQLLQINPRIELVCPKPGVPFLRNIINDDARPIRDVRGGDTLDLGGLTLEFISAPLMHWPDTMFTYCRETRVLFSCDGYAAHFSPEDEEIFYQAGDAVIEHETWYYYDSIMRPFASYSRRASQAVIDRQIDVVAPSHGLINRADPKRFIAKYLEWTEPKHRSDGKIVVIVFASSYGNTKKMAETIAEVLQQVGATVRLFDAAQSAAAELRDWYEAADAVLFGSPTFAGDVTKPVWDAAHLLPSISCMGKRAAVFGSLGWGGQAQDILETYLEKLKLKVYRPGIQARLIPSQQELEQCRAFAQQFWSFLNG